MHQAPHPMLTCESEHYRSPADRASAADDMAELLERGLSVRAAGIALGLTPGETASTWRRIKVGLGEQAA